MLNRSASCVAHEVARNTVGASYDVGCAAAVSHARRRHGPIKLRPTRRVWCRVRVLMGQGWSPDQVARRLRKMSPDDDVASQMSYETIYCASYALPRGELRNELTAQLRLAHKARKPRGRGEDRRGQLPNRTSIHLRPLRLRRVWCQAVGSGI